MEFKCSWVLFDPGLGEFNGMAPKIVLGCKGGALLSGTKDEN